MTTEVQRARPVQVIGPRLGVRAWLQDLWRFRNVLVALCLRDIRGKYKQAVLGVAWALIQPVVQVGVFTLVFRGVAGVETEQPYPVFALAALLPFNLFQQIVSLGTPAFVTSQGLVTKVYFPRLYTVLAGGASSVVNAAITAVILVLAMIYYRVTPSWTLVFAPLMLIGVVLMGIGAAALLGAINARFRDVQHALPLMMTVLLYLSPVLYPLRSMPERLQPFALLNPITGLVHGFRSCVLDTTPYSWWLLLGSFAVAVVIFAVGVWVFERTQAKLIDVL